MDLITDPGAGVCRSLISSVPSLLELWKFCLEIYFTNLPVENRNEQLQI